MKRYNRTGRSFFWFCLLAAVFLSVVFSGTVLQAVDSAAELPQIEPNASRFVSINLCTDELLVRLADSDKIMAMTGYSCDPNISTIVDQSRPFKKIRGEAEEILSLKPDIVFAGPFTHRETLSFMRKMKIPVVFIDLPADFDDIRKNIRRVAFAVGKRELGEEEINQMDARLTKLAQPLQHKPGVIFYQNGGHVPGAQTFENAIIEAAGARNLAAEMGIKGYGFMSLEALIVAKPDILIFAGKTTNIISVSHEILNHPAIQRGLPSTRIVLLPSSLLSCGTPSSVEAVELLASAIA